MRRMRRRTPGRHSGRRLAAVLLCVLVMVLVLPACGAGTTASDDAGNAAATVSDSAGRTTVSAEADSADDATAPTGTDEADAPDSTDAEATAEPTPAPIDRDGSYTSKEDVALYLHTYGELPENFITKTEAKKLGWQGGGLEDVAPGKCIGGDYFGNYEGLLPEEYDYRECDIDTLGKSSRGAKRIVFADEDHIYYTGDHYATFEAIYDE